MPIVEGYTPPAPKTGGGTKTGGSNIVGAWKPSPKVELTNIEQKYKAYPTPTAPTPYTPITTPDMGYVPTPTLTPTPTPTLTPTTFAAQMGGMGIGFGPGVINPYTWYGPRRSQIEEEAERAERQGGKQRYAPLAYQAEEGVQKGGKVGVQPPTGAGVTRRGGLPSGGAFAPTPGLGTAPAAGQDIRASQEIAMAAAQWGYDQYNNWRLLSPYESQGQIIETARQAELGQPTVPAAAYAQGAQARQQAAAQQATMEHRVEEHRGEGLQATAPGMQAGMGPSLAEATGRGQAFFQNLAATYTAATPAGALLRTFTGMNPDQMNAWLRGIQLRNEPMSGGLWRSFPSELAPKNLPYPQKGSGLTGGGGYAGGGGAGRGGGAGYGGGYGYGTYANRMGLVNWRIGF